jgi:prevent-host-death family protein
MQTRSISVTEAARNFSDCVNRARYQGVTFILHRNGVPVARIVPETPKHLDTVHATAPAENSESPSVEPSKPESFRSLW